MKYKLGNEEFDNQRDYRKALKESDHRYKSYDPWTTQDDSELLELSKTMSVYEMADYFFRVESVVLSRLKKLLSMDEGQEIQYLDGNSVDRYNCISNELFFNYSGPNIVLDGCFDGKLIEFYHQRKRPSLKKREVNFKDNEPHGKFIEWHENGQKKSEREYKNGIRHGKWTEFYENGESKSEIRYKNGNVDGKWIEWYENGQKESEREYENPVVRLKIKNTEWHENGQKKSEGFYQDFDQYTFCYQDPGLPDYQPKNPVRVKKWTYWHKNGEKKSEGNYKVVRGWSKTPYSIKDGKWIEWYENGQEKSEGCYHAIEDDNFYYKCDKESIYKPKEPVRVKKWTYWHKNGEKKSEGNYKVVNDCYCGRPYSIKDGKWIEWYESGQKESEVNFNNEDKCYSAVDEWDFLSKLNGKLED